MVKNITIALMLLLPIWALSQEEDSVKVFQQAEVGFGLLATSPKALPFWMKHNNSGRFTDAQAGALYSQLHYSGNSELAKWLKPSWEFEGLVSAGNNGSYASIIQANVSVGLPLVTISGGVDEEFFGLNDSTLSVGNLFYGNNARPIPKLRIQTNGWVASPVLSKLLSFKAYLAHGWFDSDRTQSKAFLHQKYLYGRMQLFNSRLSLVAGLNHSAQWGGQNLSQESFQPTGFKNYARIFLGMSGGGDALQTDQNNALGNHLGSYDLRGSYKFKNFTLANYWQFLWEDSSGLTPFNWRDGMVGLSLKLHQSGWVDRFVIEVVRTNDQDAYKVGEDGVPFIEPDHFFNNGVYNSGWTYGDRIIGSPMFLIFDVENSARNIVQNKINAFNIGIGGSFNALTYTLKYTDFKNNGTVFKPLETSLYVKVVDLNLQYSINKHSSLGLRANYQQSNFESGSNFGLHLSYSHTFGF